MLTLILLCACSFFLLEIYPYVFFRWDTSLSADDQMPAVPARKIVNWSFFALLLTMTLWSLHRMVFSVPCYVPRRYRYNPALMAAEDRFIFEKLQQVLHSTKR